MNDYDIYLRDGGVRDGQWVDAAHFQTGADGSEEVPLELGASPRTSPALEITDERTQGDEGRLPPEEHGGRACAGLA